MLCEKCGKRQANTVYQENINGCVTTMHLCEDCAPEINVGSLFADMYKGWESVMGSFFGTSQPMIGAKDTDFCPTCSSRLSDFSNGGRIGCADCYSHFREGLLPSVHRIHGKTNHVGKIPASAGESVKMRRELTELKTSLSKAIEEQNFEEAAKLRDKINEIEKGKDD